MVYQKYSNTNNAQTTLASDITSTSQASMVVKAGEWDLFPASNFFLVLEQLLNLVVVKREVVKVTSRTGDVLSITRSAWTCVQNDSSDPKVQWTTAYTFSAWDRVSAYFLNEDLLDLKNALSVASNRYQAVVDENWTWDYLTIDWALADWKTELLIMSWTYTLTDWNVITDKNLILHWIWNPTVSIIASWTYVFNINFTSAKYKKKIEVSIKWLEINYTNWTVPTAHLVYITWTSPSPLDYPLISFEYENNKLNYLATANNLNFYELRRRSWNFVFEWNYKNNNTYITDNTSWFLIRYNTALFSWGINEKCTYNNCMYYYKPSVSAWTSYLNMDLNGAIFNNCTLNLYNWTTWIWWRVRSFGYLDNSVIYSDRWRVEIYWHSVWNKITTNDAWFLIDWYLNADTWPINWAWWLSVTTNQVLYAWQNRLVKATTNFTSDADWSVDYMAWRIVQYFIPIMVYGSGSNFIWNYIYWNNSTLIYWFFWAEFPAWLNTYTSYSISWNVIEGGRCVMVIWLNCKFTKNSIQFWSANQTNKLLINNWHNIIEWNIIKWHYFTSWTAQIAYKWDYNLIAWNMYLDDNAVPSVTAIWSPTGNVSANNILIQI